MLNPHPHIGCPCGHLQEDECIRHKPLVRNPCAVTGFGCRRMDLADHRRNTVCPHCCQVAS